MSHQEAHSHTPYELRTGNHEEWTRFFTDVYPALCGVARLTTRTEGPEDLAQSCLEKLWCSRNRIHPQHERQLAVVAVRNLAISAGRHARAVAIYPEADITPGRQSSCNGWDESQNVLESIGPYEDTTSATIDRIVQQEEISRLLKSLSPEQKAVVLLRAEGYKEEQIAQKLGVPLGTVKSRLNRAHERAAQGIKELDRRGLSPRDIAEELHISVKTVNKALHGRKNG